MVLEKRKCSQYTRRVTPVSLQLTLYIVKARGDCYLFEILAIRILVASSLD